MLSFVLGLLLFIPSQGGLVDQLQNYIKEDLNFLISFYKDLHQNPEISLQEKQTSKKLAAELRKLGFEVTENFGGYGIVGILKNGDGPRVLYRTDMDALPMHEKTNLDYASSKTVSYNGMDVGTMHSCGHDVHMTTWLGTARAMVKMKDQWKGELMLIGQPAEEIGMGSKMMLEEGLYEKFGVPDFGFGMHCNPEMPAGKVGVSEGYTFANTESIDIKVFGKGAHGATPHLSIDPVVVASMIVMEIQTIVSRNISPMDNVVITVGAIHGGTKHNIIPDEVTLQLTVRTFTDEIRKKVHQRIREVARGVAIASGLPAALHPEVIIPEVYTPANYNDPELTNKFREIASGTLGQANVLKTQPLTVGEDFSRYGQTEENVPTIMFWLGTISEEKAASKDLPGLHSPFYYPLPEKSIETGVTVMSSTLMKMMQ
jgi:hippurate hydrolase